MKKANDEIRTDKVPNDALNDSEVSAAGGDISSVHFDRIYLALGVCVILFVIAWLLGM